jgi:hypothetical protein
VRNGTREWVLVVNKLSGGEINAVEMDRCKRIVLRRRRAPTF